MAFSMYVENLTTPTSTTTIDVTDTGFGTPVAAMCFLSNGTTAGAANNDHIYWSVGFTDGTTEKCSSLHHRNNVGSSIVHNEHRNKLLIQNYDGTDYKTLSFNSWITDGARFDWTVTTGSDDLILQVVLFGGDGSAQVGDLDYDDDLTGLSFTPDLFFTTMGPANTWDYGIGGGNFCFGMGEKDNNTFVYGQTFQSDRASTSSARAGIGNTAVSDCSPQQPQAVSIDSWDAAGISLTNSGATGRNKHYAYLVLDIDRDTVDSKIVEVSSPTSTGTQAETVGFEANELILIMSLVDTVNVTELDSPAAEAMSVGVYDGTNQTTVGFAVNDNVSTTKTQNWYANEFANVFEGDGTEELAATVDSFSATQVTLDWTVVDSTARKGYMLAIGGAPAAGPTLPHMYHHYNRNLT